MYMDKTNRMLEIFMRALRGEAIRVQKLAQEYGVSSKSISRDIASIQNFLADHRELMHHAELRYSHRQRAYIFTTDEFLKNKELFAVIKILLGSRALSKEEIVTLLAKLSRFTTTADRPMLEHIIRKEVYHYHAVKSDCAGVIDNLWRVICAIEHQHLLTITYIKMNRDEVRRRIRPAAVMFSEYYFYLIAYDPQDSTGKEKYFRIDRITSISESRNAAPPEQALPFDEGGLRERTQFMFPGEPIRVKFAFSGRSVQAVLDRLPTARIVERRDDAYIIEAEVNNGRGLMMYLLSQGAWVKVLAPDDFAEEMRQEIAAMQRLYPEKPQE